MAHDYVKFTRREETPKRETTPRLLFTDKVNTQPHVFGHAELRAFNVNVGHAELRTPLMLLWQL